MKDKFQFISLNIFSAALLLLLLSTTAFVCDKDVTVTPPPGPVSTGKIKIGSNPEGSTIYLNGRNTGRITPDSLTYLDDGTYQLTLKKRYFRDTSIVVNVTEKMPVDTSIDYLSNPLMYGDLYITSTPDSSEISINDSSLGIITPANVYDLIPGIYKISLKKFGFRDAVISNAVVESNRVKTVYASLEDTTVWVSFKTSNSNIPTNVLSCIAVDLNGVKWLGTNEYGLLRFDGSSFEKFDKNNSPLPDNKILCLTVDPSNRLWIGTNDGLASLTNGSWNVYTKDNSGLPINSIKSLAAENSSTMWIGTSLGLVKYDGSWEVYTISPNIINWINTISIDQSGNKWLGISDTSMGIVSFDGTNFTNYPREEYGYQTKNVVCSAASPSGQVWFGCNPFNGAAGGLTYFNGTDFTNISLTSFTLINSINIGSTDIKWVSTANGLYKITGTSQTTGYNTDNSPIPSNDVKGAIEDNSGIIWIATGTAGLVKFKSGSGI